MPTISLLDLPPAALREHVARGHPAWVFINPVERHGSHLSLHNDELVSMGLAADIHARLFPGTPMIVAGRMELGVDPAPGPGSRPVPYAAVRDAAVTAGQTLADLGFTSIFFATFHGAPLHNRAIQVAVDALTRRGVRAAGMLAVMFENLIDFDPATLRAAYAMLPPDIGEPLLRLLPYDFHAGYFETCLAMHYAPETVGSLAIPPSPPVVPGALPSAIAHLCRRLGWRRPAAEWDFIAWGLGWYGLRPASEYTTRPDLANAEAGRIFAASMADAIAPRLRAVLDGAAPPRPMLEWLVWLTLGGRIQVRGG